MREQISSFSVTLLEGTLNTDNLLAIINKANDLFKGHTGFMQCCSLSLVPSEKFALRALRKALEEIEIPKAKIKKPALNFLLWLYCENQLGKAIELAGKGNLFLLVIAAEDKALQNKAKELATELGFSSKKGLLESNLEANEQEILEHFEITPEALKAFSHLNKAQAIEKFALEKQALMSL